MPPRTQSQRLVCLSPTKKRIGNLTAATSTVGCGTASTLGPAAHVGVAAPRPVAAAMHPMPPVEGWGPAAGVAPVGPDPPAAAPTALANGWGPAAGTAPLAPDLPAVAPAAPANGWVGPKFCTECGTRFAHKCKFCPECGTKVVVF